MKRLATASVSSQGRRTHPPPPAIRSGVAMSPFAGRGREPVGYGDLGGCQGSPGRRVGGVHPDAPMPVILIVR